MQRAAVLSSLIILLGLSVFPQRNLITGRVIAIADGDTITLLDSQKKQIKIRLAGIDAPEKGQPFGNKAKKNLSRLLFGKNVVVQSGKTDRYDRIVGKVIFDDRDINLEQIKNGFAWHYKDYEREQSSEDRSLYAGFESLARQFKLGLWADAMPTPPWEFRHGPSVGWRRKSVP